MTAENNEGRDPARRTFVCTKCGATDDGSKRKRDGSLYAWVLRGNPPPGWATRFGPALCLSCRPRAEKPNKACVHCGGSGGFNRDSKSPDGLRNTCRACDNKKALEYRYANHEKSVAAELARQQRPEVKARRCVQQRALRARYPDRARARERLSVAIRDGKVIRQPCHKCGNPKGQGHHHDYSKPYDVEWLCSACHGKEHRTTRLGIEAARR